MIRHWKGLDLEITDFNYQHDLTHSGENIHIPTQYSSYVIRGNYFIMRVERVKKAKLDRAEQKCKREAM